MPHNYIPRPDGDFDAWMTNFRAGALPYFDVHGPGDGEVDYINELAGFWASAYAEHIELQARARGGAAAKNAARAACEQEIRRLVRDIQSRPITTDAERAGMGLSVPPPSPQPATAPTTRPLARVESGQRLAHTVRFGDEATPTRSARPHGVLGAEVWVALTPPSQAPPPMGAAYRFQALSSKGSARRTFPAAEAGKTAHYWPAANCSFCETTDAAGGRSSPCASAVAAMLRRPGCGLAVPLRAGEGEGTGHRTLGTGGSDPGSRQRRCPMPSPQCPHTCTPSP